MAQTIQITPQEVRQVGTRFKTQSQASTQMMNDLKSAMQGLQAGWKGTTQQRFYQEFQEWLKMMQQHATLLQNIGTELDKIAQKFEAADRAA